MSRATKLLAMCLEKNLEVNVEAKGPNLMPASYQQIVIDTPSDDTNKKNVSLLETPINMSNSVTKSTQHTSKISAEECLSEFDDTNKENVPLLETPTNMSNSVTKSTQHTSKISAEECLSEFEESDDSDKDPNYDRPSKKRKTIPVVPCRRSSSSSSSSSSSTSSSSATTSSSSSSRSSSTSSSSSPKRPASVSILKEPNSNILEQGKQDENTKETNRTRKRQRVEGQWKQNVTKALRNSGLSYKTKSGRTIPDKGMKQSCGEHCRLKCSSLLTSEMRLELFNSYWALNNLEKQRQFVHKHIRPIEVKYRYVKAQKPRKSNYAFYFEIEGLLKRVCKTMFKNTLDINDRTIRTVTNKSAGGFLEEDGRGKHKKHYTIGETIKNDVRNHIKSIPKIESHYLRTQTTRVYIDGGKTISDLHRDYVAQCKQDGREYANYVMYSRIFNHEFNIGFFVPKKDRCELCVAYENSDLENKAKLQLKYDEHLLEKNLSRQEKKKDKIALNNNENLIVAVYDLQAVLQVPRGDVSVFYYKSKLNNMNFTVSKLKPNTEDESKGENKKRINKKKPINDDEDIEPIVNQSITECYFWHEAEGNRGADEIGSCLLKFIEKELNSRTGNESVDIIFYSDNCCGQNKNKYIVAMYMYAILKYPQINSITHKYLITGHTQNEGDSVHSVIEKQIKRSLKSGPIYVPSQYVQIIKEAKATGEPLRVNALSHIDFISLKNLCCDMGIATINKIKISDVKVMSISKDRPNILKYKTSYKDGEWMEANLLSRNKKITIPGTKPAYSTKLKIKENKKTDLITLLLHNHIPGFYSDFFSNL